MVKRQLSDEERKMNELAITREKKSLKLHEYNIKYNDLLINEGLQANFDHQMEVLKAQRAQANAEAKLSSEKIRVLQDQVDNGVEQKGAN